jgi:hypothetical protein
MTNAAQRLRQFFIGILAVLSLSASPVAACACSHHAAEPKAQKSCHSPAPKKHENHGPSTRTPSFCESCLCVQPAIKLSVKAEGFKFKKQASVLSNGLEETHVRYYRACVETDPAHKSELEPTQFSGSTSSRGPPVS